MEEALEQVQKEKGLTLIKHALQKAYEDEKVLVAILKKFWPDRRSIEHSGEIDHSVIHELSPALTKKLDEIYRAAGSK